MKVILWFIFTSLLGYLKYHTLDGTLQGLAVGMGIYFTLIIIWNMLLMLGGVDTSESQNKENNES